MSEKLLTIDQFKQQYRIPDSYDFLGFIIQRLDTDEFLAFYKNDSFMEQYGWSLLPEPQFVIVYSQVEEPVKWIRKQPDKPCIVSLLFDTGPQHMVFPYHVPKHLKPLVTKVFPA